MSWWCHIQNIRSFRNLESNTLSNVKALVNIDWILYFWQHGINIKLCSYAIRSTRHPSGSQWPGSTRQQLNPLRMFDGSYHITTQFLYFITSLIYQAAQQMQLPPSLRARNSQLPGSQCDEKWRRAITDPKYRSRAGDHIFRNIISKLHVFTISRDVENGKSYTRRKLVFTLSCATLIVYIIRSLASRMLWQRTWKHRTCLVTDYHF